MDTNTLERAAGSLGPFLRDRRSRLQPGPEAQVRRRTPGLRREEVAARAGVSVTWYTWLEQGRGGPPSDEVLERLARALELDGAAREVLFLLARNRPPPIQPAAPSPVPASLQRVLDSLTTSPAIVKTPLWDVVAWNAAAAVVLGDPGEDYEADRNLLRRFFTKPMIRERLPQWEEQARFILSVFRIDLARAGDVPEAAALIAELQAGSADFRRLWAENEVRSYGMGVKELKHPIVGPITVEYSAFAVDGAEGLTMVVFTPVAASDVQAVERLLALPLPHMAAE
jgi:transcriptional regulator with XRE-family HTH domain